MKDSTTILLGFLTAIVVMFSCSGSHSPAAGSAICGVNGSVQCRTGEVCNLTYGCSQCNSDKDCPATDPRCIEGRCEVCATNADCGAAMPACWADHRCHAACTSNTDCQNTQGLAICDTASGDCIGCKTNTDCAGTPR